MPNLLNYDRRQPFKVKHAGNIPDGMIKCYYVKKIRFPPSMMDEILERPKKLFRPQWRGVITSGGQKCVHNLGNNCTRKQKMHWKEPSKMGRIVAKNGVFSSAGTKMTDIAKFLGRSSSIRSLGHCKLRSHQTNKKPSISKLQVTGAWSELLVTGAGELQLETIRSKATR